MKNELWLLVALIVASCVIVVNRYQITVNTPVVVKLDRFTGQAWIAKGGMWMPLKDSTVCMRDLMPSHHRKAE